MSTLKVMTVVLRAPESELRSEFESLESTVLPGVGFGVVVGKILPTPTPARSCRIPHVSRQ